MELRQYWGVLERRLWLVVLLVVLALASSLIMRPHVEQSYQAQVKFAVKPSGVSTASFYSAEYYNYLASEFLLDDVASSLQTSTFMAEVQDKLKSRPGGPPAGGIQADKVHRVLVVSVNAATAQDALDLTTAVGELLTEPGSKYFGQLTNEQQDVEIVQPGMIVGVPGESRTYMDLVLRLVLGLLAGIGLAFLLDYLDDTLRGRGDIERSLGLPVMGEIPREKRGFFQR